MATPERAQAELIQQFEIDHGEAVDWILKFAPSLNTEETVGVAIGALAVAGAAAGIFMKFKLERGQQGPLLTSSSDAHQALATSDHEAAAVTEGSEACSI